MPTSRLALPPNPSLTKNLWTLAFSLGGWVEKQKPVNVHRVVAVVHLDGLLTKHRVTVRLLQRRPLLKNLAYTEPLATCRMTHPSLLTGQDKCS